MNDRIHFPLAKLAATELFEALVAAQHDKKYGHVHRETIEQQFEQLAHELGFRVEPIAAPVLEAAE